MNRTVENNPTTNESVPEPALPSEIEKKTSSGLNPI